MLRVIICCALLAIAGSTLTVQTYRGIIAGRIVDARSQEPLPGVNVIVVQLPNTGTTTNTRGTFRIENLEVGTYSLRVSAVQYDPRILTNVVVTTGRETPVHIALEDRPVESSEVTVQADYFSRAEQMSPLREASL